MPMFPSCNSIFLDKHRVKAVSFGSMADSWKQVKEFLRTGSMKFQEAREFIRASDLPEIREGREFMSLAEHFIRARRPAPSTIGSSELEKAHGSRSPIGTIDWLATEIGCSVRQARRYCRQRMVPGAYQVNKGGPWRIRKADARAWIEKTKC